MDLRALFPKYKTKLEFEGADPADPNSWIIPATDGHFYVHGPGVIGAATDRNGPLAKRLIGLPCILSGQIGDDGINVQFRVEDFAAVTKVMKPRIKRTLSAEHRAKFVAAGERFRKLGSGARGEALEIVTAA